MPPPDLVLNGRSPSRASRSLSVSSDRTSQTGHSGGLLSPPLTTSPEAAFIAASAASQIVTNDHDSRADTWFDQHGIEPSGETALVSPPALKLVNRFLDQLLFGFLSISKSTSLAALRPAVSEVLSAKLARSAIQGAEQELHEYLGGGDDEDILSLHDGAEKKNNWDLELVWKRTRLRCMVYSSLGDMEEEDEDYYTEQEQLQEPSDSTRQFSPGVVSPAVAIFLTSILEFMGEQILIVAGQSAYNRLRAKLEREEREGTSNHGDIADRVVVEEHDMERVAMDRTLGRIWRGWKKRIRSPTASVSLPRSFSRESMFSQSPVSGGPNTADEIIVEEARRPSLATVLAEYEQAATIPLPLSDNDIREIEIPGLAAQSDDEDADEESDDEDIRPTRRPKSLIFFARGQSSTPEESKPEGPIFLSLKTRTRSHSLPPPAPARYSSKHKMTTPDTEVEEAIESEEAIGSEQVDESKEISPEINEESVEATVETPVAVKTEEKTGEENGEESDDNELAMPIQGAKVAEEEESKGLMTGVVAGAAAIGAAAAVGIAAAIKGEAPQTEPTHDESDAYDLTEEPQIMTSSRVSIGGRRSPDDNIISSTASIHSLRVVDVASPTLSRSNSLHSPLSEQAVRIGSPVSRGPTASPVPRSGSALSTRQLRNSVGPSIIEEKEAVTEQAPTRGTPVPSEVAGTMQGVDVDHSPTHEHSGHQTHDYKSSKAAPFVLSAPPNTRQPRGPTSHPSEELNYPPRPTFATSRTVSTEHGAPPLTPLREMVEGAPDTSDEASSIAPSNYSQQGAYGHSPSASGSTLSQGQREHRPARNQPTIITRTSPPRPSPPREEMRRPVESLTKPPRSSHTTGSTSSSTSHKLKPLRTSEDSAPTMAENKSQSFEQLIRSDQTIQYTLTPQNMRNIESPDSPRHAITPTIISNGFDSRRPQTSRSRSSSNSKHLPIQSNTPVEQPRSPKLSKAPTKPVQRVNSNSGTKIRPNAPQARDARVDRESVNDFAEFIRSTGPTNGYNGGPPRPIQAHRGTNGTPRNASGTVSRTTNVTTLPRRAESSAGRNKLQAREAVVPRGDSISDLIDFVRSGPQLEKDNHRIPRTVAPFRSTMDSDQMVGATGGKAIDASFPETRYSQSTSINSSVNSQSALINGNSKARGLGLKQSQDFDEETTMPKRKTRRVRDPYAIDLSDDEDDDYEPFTKPKPIQEESLADFLKNVPPPAESTVQPIYNVTPAKNIKKKSSSHSFRSRFSRKESITSLPSKPKSSSNGAEARTSSSRDAPRLPTHTPIAAQYATTPATYEPSRSGSYVSQVDGARRVAQKSYQPRDAVYTSSRTNDLADFLMKSDPPQQQIQPKTLSPSLQKEEGTLQRMFGRKKVH